MRNLFLICLSIVFLSACEAGSSSQAIVQPTSIIPAPTELSWQDGYFQFDEQSCFIVPAGDADLLQIGSQLAQIIRKSTGLPLPVKTLDDSELNNNAVILRRDERIESPEAYHLSIDKNAIRVSANSASGIFYGIQTIRQMLPIAGPNDQNAANLRLPAVKIV
ncbi:MAG: glycoside hydrolase family 20 zincin-like fold domain-containing protein, partial [Bacteroidota bacterium]